MIDSPPSKHNNEMASSKSENLLSPMSDNSFDEDNEISLETQYINLEKTLKHEAKKAKDIEKKVAQLTQQHQLKLKQIKDNFDEELLKIQLKYAIEIGDLEEKLLSAKQLEREVRQKSIHNRHIPILDLLSQINIEYQKLESDLQEISTRQEKKISKKKNKKKLLETQLQSQISKLNEQRDAISEIDDKYQRCLNELKDQLPASQEFNTLNIKIAELEQSIEQGTRKLKMASIGNEVNKEFIMKIRENFNPTFELLFRFIRIKHKIDFLSSIVKDDTSKFYIESLLHLIDCALFVFQNNVNNFSESTNLSNHLAKLEENLDHKRFEDLDLLNQITSLLQKHTPIPLHLATTSHLIKSISIKCESSTTKTILENFSHKFPSIFHPLKYTEAKENLEKIALEIREELHKAEDNQSFFVSQFDSKLQNFFANSKQNSNQFNLQKEEKSENVTTNGNDDNDDDKELLELRRNANDLDSVLDVLNKYNNALNKRRTKIEKEIKKTKKDIKTYEEQLAIYEEFNK
ncbi:hypothetical protein GPJ56_010485 [Histomonas meleagridis]|uniref:uncharacterized protein n=1 Tax=Histomonas meleagridis TaxID=135588 RepID=UPI0035598982|nr:hypothetical protein GPJ56_010485 [Histomonas meleagridis]KAH0798038.1 hypothetical protein GO595_009151 [Histomonas meleagridis]